MGYKLTHNTPTELVAGSYLPDAKDAKEISDKERKEVQKKEVDSSKFTLSIYPEATFKNGKSTGELYIRNEISNAYPIAVQLIENQSGDIIYESGAIQPGYEVTEGKLLKDLKKGNYKCTAEVSIFDSETDKYKGQTAAEVNVEVKE
ncbi:hypothetical protein [Lactococcus garvieae]|uniref:Uncharacterized protein n=1 Tax=Lactococcus garvieae TaxID=1363 RepID=A0AA46YSV0_9LACT|nr:hypothetical protein [Lactococcus garvieae]UYT09866.1 hypothetical protein OF801_07770 [Lactococcus garvieae]UYT11839.1 hypothetical protein OF800_07430 [Lactococcus garvieae]